MKSDIFDRVILLNLIALSVLFLMIPLSYATPLVVDTITAQPDPIKWNDGNITITARVQRIDSDPDVVKLLIISPETINLTPYQVEVIDSQSWRYYFSFNPSNISEYRYLIWANDTYGEVTETNYFYFDSIPYPFIKYIFDDGPVKYDDPNGIISFDVWVDKWDSNITDVTLIISGPETLNITMTKYNEVDNTSYYSAQFNPSQKALYRNGVWSSLYQYQIYAVDSSGEYTYSELNYFISESYPPEIEDVNSSGIIIPLGSVYSVDMSLIDRVNYTNSSSNVNGTWIIINTPNGTERYDMYEINDIYKWNYTPSQEYIYTYRIYISDEEGNLVVSPVYMFTTKPLGIDTTNIEVEVAPHCCGGMMLLPNERYVLANQTVIWLSIFSNCGNVPLTEYTNITIRKDVINENGAINESTLVLIPPNIIDYALDTEDYVDPLRDSYFFMIWYTSGLPLGNYTAETWSFFESNISEGNTSFYCNGTSNTTVHFEIVNEIGENTKPPVLLIREMTPQTTQNTLCDPVTQNNCVSNKVKLIILNIGKDYVYNLSFTDKVSVESCKSANLSECKIPRVLCISNCSISYDLSDTNQTNFLINFSVIEGIAPREYKIVEYEYIPPINSGVYDPLNPSVLIFDAVANYSYNGVIKTSRENNVNLNPPESKLLNLYTRPSFDYDLRNVDRNGTNIRSYNLNTLNNFTLEVYPSFNSSYVLNSWFFQINFTRDMVVDSCTYVSGPECSCEIHNIDENHTDIIPNIVCRSNTSFYNNDITVLSVVLNGSKSNYFTAPAYSDSNDSLGSIMNEFYIPGLFLISNPPQPKPEPNPEPEPQPQPVPRPEPEPEPQPEPEPKPKVELILTPINDTYLVEQGQTFPTFFWIENIGNATATNIQIVPKIPNSDWNFSLTLVDELKPGEKVNRTLMFSLTDNIKPGIYVLPVSAVVGNETADIAYITVEVKEQKNKAKIQILESPPEVEIRSNSNLTIPVYLKNIGKKDLHLVTARIENTENCLEYIQSEQIDLNISKEGSLNIKVKSKEGPKECTGLLIISSKENAYAFAPIKIIVKPKPPLIPLKGQLTPIITLVWTLMLIIYTIIRKRKIRHGTARPSKTARLIVYLLLLGELIIFIYIILWMIGIIEII